MSNKLLKLAALFVLVACGQSEDVAGKPAARFNIDSSRITVSGVSAGAYMAGQLHLAHSAVFSGAALLAGGPYYCAEGSLQKGLGPCMKGGDSGIPALADYAKEMAATGQIDALDNLQADRVWLFHGSQDAVVDADVLCSAREFYAKVAAGIQPVLVENIAVTHGMPTVDKGVACDEMASPFLNACGYDAAGELLAGLAVTVEEKSAASGQLIEIPQPGYGAAQMLGKAFLYVPAACAAGEACGVHVAFHGCRQSAEFVADAFARDAGYNEWAESNRLLVLYPQVASSKMMPMNPNGCWDWWGYTGENYATKSAAQITVVMAMIDELSAAAP